MAGRPPGYAWAIPFLTVRNPAAALEFYRAAFGFESAHVNEQGGRILHAELKYRNEIILMVCPEGQHGTDVQSPAATGKSSPIDLLIYVDDVDQVCERARHAGGRPVGDPRTHSWGERIGHVIDPEGYRWVLTQVVGEP
jgi:uncharacterized glyoxalase superfamily protein PhnB